jgi:undecaprenyl diphosphate synthase
MDASSSLPSFEYIKHFNCFNDGGKIMLEMFTKWRASKKQSESKHNGIDLTRVPEHIAIIMDGNGRWAKKRNLPRIAGHKEGMSTVKRIAIYANSLGVKVLTVYAFSTENWKRPRTEVDFIMKLPDLFLGSFLPELMRQEIQVRIIGDTEHLPAHTRDAVMRTVEATKNNNRLILNFALNYGSRVEIVQAVKSISEDVKHNKITTDEITEELFSNHLLTKDIADPDLLIRTSGELRISNFLMWQISYSELWFTNVLWPDFNEEHLASAIEDYQQRKRRFGGLQS